MNKILLARRSLVATKQPFGTLRMFGNMAGSMAGADQGAWGKGSDALELWETENRAGIIITLKD